MLLVSMDFSSRIRHYYLSHYDDLPLEKRFHFASRLAAWEKHQPSLEYLESQRIAYVGTSSNMESSLRELLHTKPTSSISGYKMRSAYFTAYPSLFGLSIALFRVRHLLYVYNVDERDALLRVIPESSLHKLAADLSADPSGFATLSTYAVNYTYLVEHILYAKHQRLITPENYYDHADRYSLNDPEQLRLFIYLYTHCVIAESNFYERPLVAERLAAYGHMITRLDDEIGARFSDVSLDNKLEFLVAARLCEITPQSRSRIIAECEASLSSEGDFLIDTHNTFSSSDKKSFVNSEHRNVLFIMATTPRAV